MSAPSSGTMSVQLLVRCNKRIIEMKNITLSLVILTHTFMSRKQDSVCMCVLERDREKYDRVIRVIFSFSITGKLDGCRQNLCGWSLCTFNKLIRPTKLFRSYNDD